MGPAHRYILASALLCLSPACKQTTASPRLDPACDDGQSCRDSDCDRICDTDEGYPDRDTDGDGIPDYQDLDSDNDGFDDREEAGDDDLRTLPIDRNDDGTPDFIEARYPRRPWEPSGGQPDGSTVVPVVMDGGVADAAVDGGGEYTLDSGPLLQDQCAAEQQVAPGCSSHETDPCDGLDNDCDGVVDGDKNASCGCRRGEVRNCFQGPPGRRGVGACTDGHQVCLGEEFTYWGPCTGAIAPSTELCDGIDNDCNGCTDEIEECVGKLQCPEPGDPRIPSPRPYEDVVLEATDFYLGDDATGYLWEISGSPCDDLFQAIDSGATSENGRLSYRVSGAGSATATARFSLSGSYSVRLTILTPEDELACEWVMPVRGDGVRVELCWPNTGAAGVAQGGRVDLDLHLARQGNSSVWGSSSDCYHQTCKGATSPWGVAPTNDVNVCLGSRNTATYEVIDKCPNPRLDADNRLETSTYTDYVTENINFDSPTAGDRLRVMVEYNAAQEVDPAPQTEPLVNIYCGGNLKATLGGDPAVLADDSDEVSGLDTPGERWKVADVQVAAGGRDTDCTVVPLSAPDGPGYWVDETGDNTIAW